ncbi:hypothetical protein [Lonepinella sp. MS14435]|uniref:hypothetical protein n=1 Tax=unclassified Lonepinella TaxID=2642006 RepID=UPI0036DEE507
MKKLNTLLAVSLLTAFSLNAYAEKTFYDYRTMTVSDFEQGIKNNTITKEEIFQSIDNQYPMGYVLIDVYKRMMGSVVDDVKNSTKKDICLEPKYASLTKNPIIITGKSTSEAQEEMSSYMNILANAKQLDEEYMNKFGCTRMTWDLQISMLEAELAQQGRIKDTPALKGVRKAMGME